MARSGDWPPFQRVFFISGAFQRLARSYLPKKASLVIILPVHCEIERPQVVAFSLSRQGEIMAKCEICGKGPRSGQNVSFSQRKTKRLFKPNIQRVSFYESGHRTRKYICTRCMKTLAKNER
jgi:large subunit ribosomal protein L28